MEYAGVLESPLEYAGELFDDFLTNRPPFDGEEKMETLETTEAVVPLFDAAIDGEVAPVGDATTTYFGPDFSEVAGGGFGGNFELSDDDFHDLRFLHVDPTEYEDPDSVPLLPVPDATPSTHYAAGNYYEPSYPQDAPAPDSTLSVAPQEFDTVTAGFALPVVVAPMGAEPAAVPAAAPAAVPAAPAIPGSPSSFTVSRSVSPASTDRAAPTGRSGRSGRRARGGRRPRGGSIDYNSPFLKVISKSEAEGRSIELASVKDITCTSHPVIRDFADCGLNIAMITDEAFRATECVARFLDDLIDRAIRTPLVVRAGEQFAVRGETRLLLHLLCSDGYKQAQRKFEAGVGPKPSIVSHGLDVFNELVRLGAMHAHMCESCFIQLAKAFEKRLWHLIDTSEVSRTSGRAYFWYNTESIIVYQVNCHAGGKGKGVVMQPGLPRGFKTHTLPECECSHQDQMIRDPVSLRTPVARAPSPSGSTGAKRSCKRRAPATPRRSRARVEVVEVVAPVDTSTQPAWATGPRSSSPMSTASCDV